MNLINARDFENELFRLQEELGKKAFFCSVGMFRKTKMVVKSRITKVANPFDVIYKYSSNTYGLNYNYADQVNKQREREGIEEEYEVLKPYGKHHVTRMILQSDKDENQYYLQIAINSANKGKATYFDKKGNVLKLEDIKEYLDVSEFKHYKSKRQGTEKEIKPLTPKLQTIVKMKMGRFAYNETDKLPVKID